MYPGRGGAQLRNHTPQRVTSDSCLGGGIRATHANVRAIVNLMRPKRDYDLTKTARVSEVRQCDGRLAGIAVPPKSERNLNTGGTNEE